MILALGVLLGLMLVNARVMIDPRSGRASGFLPGALLGDEPHYLLMLNSLIFDHDLQLQQDYQRVARGALWYAQTMPWPQITIPMLWDQPPW